MKMIVTGCAGFIGVNFTKYILKQYPQDLIVGIDRLTYAANLAALAELKREKNFIFYQNDICDREKIEGIFQKEAPDVVINFAAESHVDRSISDARVFVESNVLGAQVLLDASLHCGIKRFHQISTDEVYGDLSLDSDEAFTENAPLKPSSPYSASKAAADLLALAYYKTHGLPVTISRSTNNYGPYQHGEKLIPLAIEKALRNEPVPLYGDGKNARDWIYVEDHCRAVDLIVRKGTVGNVYNVGGNTVYANIDLVGEILSLLNKPRERIEFVADRKGHDRKYALRCDKIERELGWKSCVDFSEGLRETVAWYRAQYGL